MVVILVTQYGLHHCRTVSSETYISRAVSATVSQSRSSGGGVCRAVFRGGETTSSAASSRKSAYLRPQPNSSSTSTSTGPPVTAFPSSCRRTSSRTSRWIAVGSVTKACPGSP